jgi:hypothetical protein
VAAFAENFIEITKIADNSVELRGITIRICQLCQPPMPLNR